jgi:calcineurin-like phosphoesterase
MTTILFIGDVVGRPGRELVRRAVPALVAQQGIDLVIANVENAAAGFGVTPDIADDFLSYGVHVMTGGNHTWDKKEILPYFAEQPRLLRPANMPAGTPGHGRCVVTATNGVSVGVVNGMGRVFMTAPGWRRSGLRRLSRRGHLRKGGHGLASRRPGHGGRRHAHACADGR